MSLVLVEFTDQSVDKVPVSNIQYCPDIIPKVGSDCVVNWKMPGKKSVTSHSAKVLKVGGNTYTRS